MWPINFKRKKLNFAILMALSLTNATFADIRHSDHHELELIRAIEELKLLEIDPAIARLEVLIDKNPGFKLAKLMYADLLQAKSAPLSSFGQYVSGNEEALTSLQDEARARWKHFNQHPNDNLIPRYLVQLNSEHENIIVVDTSQSRLLLYRNNNGRAVLIDDFYASIGKNGVDKRIEGDKKTPLGVYFVSRYLEQNTLPDFYGHGAFPINYPNSWDKFQGRTGSGIWLHGNPLGTFARPPLDSDGCVTVSNSDFDRLKPYIALDQKTPFVISDGIDWVDTKTLKQEKQTFLTKLEQWKKDWESQNNSRYLSHYSQDFLAEGKDYAQWKNEKVFVNNSKEYINIALDDISIFQYPGDDQVTIITFKQSYESNNFQGTERKRLYLKKEKDSQWRIFYEGSV